MAHVQNYMKKPIQVQAVLFEGGQENAEDVISWIKEHCGAASYQPYVPTQVLYSQLGDIDPLNIAGKPEGIYVNGPLFTASWKQEDYFARPGDYIVLEKDGTFSVFSLEDLHNDYVYLD